MNLKINPKLLKSKQVKKVKSQKDSWSFISDIQKVLKGTGDMQKVLMETRYGYYKPQQQSTAK